MKKLSVPHLNLDVAVKKRKRVTRDIRWISRSKIDVLRLPMGDGIVLGGHEYVPLLHIGHLPRLTVVDPEELDGHTGYRYHFPLHRDVSHEFGYVSARIGSRRRMIEVGQAIIDKSIRASSPEVRGAMG